MTPSRLLARTKNCRARWLAVMGFGAQAPNEARDALALTTQNRKSWIFMHFPIDQPVDGVVADAGPHRCRIRGNSLGNESVESESARAPTVRECLRLNLF
jgi:hypothetical protein